MKQRRHPAGEARGKSAEVVDRAPAEEPSRRALGGDAAKIAPVQLGVTEKLSRGDEGQCARAEGQAANVTPRTRAEQAFLDAVDEAEAEAADLAGPLARCELDIFEHVPLPQRRRWLATIARTEQDGDLRAAVISAVQDAGRWGDLDLSLTWRVRCPGKPHRGHNGRGCQGRANWSHIARQVHHYGLSVPWTAEAAAAAAHRAAPSVTPVTARDPNAELLTALLKALAAMR